MDAIWEEGMRVRKRLRKIDGIYKRLSKHVREVVRGRRRFVGDVDVGGV